MAQSEGPRGRSRRATLISIEHHPARTLAAVRSRAPYADVDRVVGDALRDVYRHLTRARRRAAGAPIAQYVHADGGFDVLVGVPVNGPVPPSERVVSITLPAGTVASSMHTGAASGLAHAYEAIDAWLGRAGYQAVGHPWETYAGPRSRPRRRTVVSLPCAPAEGPAPTQGSAPADRCHGHVLTIR